MAPEFDPGMDEAVDRFWDKEAQGRSGSAGVLDPADVATIRSLHAHDDRPAPNPAFIRQLREELMHAHAIQVSSNPSASPLPNGRASRPWPMGPQTLPPSGRQRALTQLATAVLLLLTLVGSFLAFGPGRYTPPGEQSAVIPAIGATPATPDTDAQSIAEFVWQATGSPERRFGELGRPAIDPAGNLWAPDSVYDQYMIFAPDGTFLESWGTSGRGQGEFNFVCDTIPYGGIAFDTTGAIYVVDSGNYRIQKFSPDRALLTSWGSQGAAANQFLCPAAIAIDQQGRVYVSDRGAGKIIVFDGDGAWLDTWPDLGTPTGVAVDGTGDIWVADYSGQRVMKLSPDGERLATWEESATGARLFVGPNNVAVDAEGRVFVTEHDGNRVQVFAPDGSLLGAWGELGSAPGQFQEPRGIVLDGQGGAYVSEWAGNRVQKFRLLPLP